MNWLLILYLILSVCFVWYLVQAYSYKNVPLYLKIIISGTWLLSFGIVFLLPVDVYYSLVHDEKRAAHVLLIWKIVYWLNFLATWLLLPLAQEYELAGYFRWQDKLKRSIRNNLIVYGIFGLIGGLFLIYMIMRGDVDIKQLMDIMVAASNVFGMVLVVILLSHGIVAIPKKLWMEKNYEGMLLKNQFSASVLHKEKIALLLELELRTKEILAFQRINGRTAYTNIILGLVPRELVEKWERSVPSFIEIDIVSVHKYIKRMVLDLGRLESRWNTLTLNTFRIYDVVRNNDSVDHKIHSTLFHEYNNGLVNKLIWLWHCRLKPCLLPIFCVLLSIFALAVVLAELSIFTSWLDYINVFRLVHRLESFPAVNFSTLVPLGYISFCVFYGLFKLKLAGYYGIYRGHTDSPSLIFSALNCSRVAAPLCYNFLQLVDVKDSAYVNVMGTVDIAPVFGRTFNFIFPLLLLLLILFNTFDIYSKISKAIGIKKLQFDYNNLNKYSILDGKTRLQKARTDLEHRILNNRYTKIEYFGSYKDFHKNDDDSSEPNSSNDDKASSEQLEQPQIYFNNFGQRDLLLKILYL